MKIVDEATRAPGYCLASRDTDGPFFDTGLQARHRDPHMYIGVRWVEERAKELGFVSGEEVEELKLRLAAFDARFEQLEKFVDAHSALEEAVEVIGGYETPDLPDWMNGEGI